MTLTAVLLAAILLVIIGGGIFVYRALVAIVKLLEQINGKLPSPDSLPHSYPSDRRASHAGAPGAPLDLLLVEWVLECDLTTECCMLPFPPLNPLRSCPCTMPSHHDPVFLSPWLRMVGPRRIDILMRIGGRGRCPSTNCDKTNAPASSVLGLLRRPASFAVGFPSQARGPHSSARPEQRGVIHPRANW